jgi:hypothetical protein
VADGLDKDWGDANESAFKSILNYTSTGAFRTQSTDVFRENSEIKAGNTKLDASLFKGTVERAHKL